MKEFIYSMREFNQLKGLWKMETTTVEMHLEEVTDILIACLRSRRIARGDAFATADEMTYILSDPWAWYDLVRIEMRDLLSSDDLVLDTVYPDHNKNIAELVYEVENER